MLCPPFTVVSGPFFRNRAPQQSGCSITSSALATQFAGTLEDRGMVEHSADFRFVEPSDRFIKRLTLLDLGACRRKSHVDLSELGAAHRRQRIQMIIKQFGILSKLPQRSCNFNARVCSEFVSAAYDRGRMVVFGRCKQPGRSRRS